MRNVQRTERNEGCVATRDAPPSPPQLRTPPRLPPRVPMTKHVWSPEDNCYVVVTPKKGKKERTPSPTSSSPAASAKATSAAPSPSAPPTPGTPRPDPFSYPGRQRDLARLSEEHQLLLRQIEFLEMPQRRDKILEQCETQWGQAPPAVRRLGHTAVANWHMQKIQNLRTRVDPKAGTPSPALAERLRRAVSVRGDN